MTSPESESKPKDAPASQDPGPRTIRTRIDALPGVLPRHAQGWVIGALALVMVVIIAFSGHNAPKPKQPTVPQLTASDPNSSRIEDYRRRIEEETNKLNRERDQWVKEQGTRIGISADTGSSLVGRADASSSAVGTSPENWIDEDRVKREYQSLYSSNLALSYREQETEPLMAAAPQRVLAKRLAHDAEDEDSHATEESGQKKTDSDLKQAIGPEYRVFEGSFLETVLTNRLDGVFSGPVNCMTTTDIYSHDGQHVLIPSGSRVLGEVKRVDTFGQERLAVVFHRMIMPDGYTVSLDKFRGLNQVGETGLKDQINHHYLQVFGVSIAIGAVGGFSAANTRYGSDVSATDAYRQGVADSLSQSSTRILDRYLSVLPTITIREGQRVKIYLANDLLLPAYENHRMPNN